MRVCAALLALLSAVTAADPEVETLRGAGLSPQKAAIRAYLRSLVPGHAEKRARGLVARLGSTDPAERAEASRRLLRLYAASIPALTDAVHDSDPEVSRRARDLLAIVAKLPRPGLMYAVFRVVAKRRILGLGAEMVAVLPLCGRPYLRRSAREALVVTALPGCLPLLRTTVSRRRDPFVRTAALYALAAVQGVAGKEEIAGWLLDADNHLRCAAAWALAELHDRRCFPVFVGLLDAPQQAVRRRTVQALRAISGKRFGYASNATGEARMPKTQAWRRWSRDHAASATWSAPLQVGDRGYDRILVSIPGERRLVEIDLAGKVIWERKKLPNTWPCAGTPDGNRLVGYFDRQSVVEYDANGRVVWQKEGLPGKPCSVQRLENGNTLVAVGSASKVIEYAPNGTIAWEVSLPGRTFFARRLRNGRTLVTLHDSGRVLEVTPDKKSIEKFKIAGGPYTVQQLENGNALICLPGSGKVVERTPAGKIVWSVKGLGWCATAARLPGGDTIVGHNKGVDRIGPDGKRKTLLAVRGTVFLSAH